MTLGVTQIGISMRKGFGRRHKVETWFSQIFCFAVAARSKLNKPLTPFVIRSSILFVHFAAEMTLSSKWVNQSIGNISRMIPSNAQRIAAIEPSKSSAIWTLKTHSFGR